MAGGRQWLSGTRRWLKPLRTVVAWRGRAEWDQVMVGLYCGDGRLQQEALDRVSAWKSRYGPKMPLAVDCTAELIRCKVLDSSGRLRSHELILSYGLALVRFVNLITERKQKMVSIPLRQLAIEVDIPIWVVDLRHELTHGKLPRLALCRKGCDVVLDWLRKTYWSRQLGNNLCEESEEEEEEEEEEQEAMEANTELDNDTWEVQTPQHEACQKHKEFHEKVRDVLISYKDEQFRVMQTVQSVSKSRELWSNSSSEVDWILAQIKDLMQENRETVAEVLLSDGFLIPTVDCLKMLNIKYEANKEVWQFRIPQTFYCFWQPLLTGLLSRSFTQTLIDKMFMKLKECSDSSELRPQFLINWISEMLTSIARVNSGKKRRRGNKRVYVKELFLQKVPLQWIRLTENCLEAPCWATPHLLQLILTSMRPRLPRSSRKNLLYLTSIYTEGGGPLSSPGLLSNYSEQPIYTIESLQWRARQENQVKNEGQAAENQEDVLEKDDGLEEVEEEEEEMVTETNHLEGLAHSDNVVAIAEKKAALQGSAWQITGDEIQWKDFPLGKLPGQTDDPDGLMLDNYSMMSLLDQPVRDEWKSPNTNSAELNIPVTGGLLWTQNDFHKIKSGLQLF
ncbi:ribosomal biogenesis protein LAS1L [Anser cygnoides]|uniref:ribosomal biogenesis protein LAS1L n=1 Tax=Anser cygnoides TaxID=8845 RepID=UPI0034D2E523